MFCLNCLCQSNCFTYCMYLLFINPLTRNFQLTGLKTICILIANVRKLSLYVSLCINCYNMNTKRATEKLILYYYSPLNSIKIALSAKLAVISKMERYISLPKIILSFFVFFTF